MNSSESLQSLTKNYTIATSFLILILGILGHLLNILTFTKLKIFRNNQCVFYLIIESIVNSGGLIFQSILQFLTIIYGSDLSEYSPPWCKIRSIIEQTFLLLSLSAVCLSAIDQYLSTSYVVYIRQMSSMRLSRRLIIISLCFSVGHSISFGSFFHSRLSVDCIISHLVLMNYYTYFFYPILVGLLPMFVSSLFSVLAYRNVRRIVRRQTPII